MSGPRILDGTGQEFDDVVEVMVLVRHRDGREDGWVINAPSRCGWRLTQIGSAHARVTVEGEFYRKAKDASSRRIEAEMHGRALDGPSHWMLEEGADE